MLKIEPINDFVLVERITETQTENNFTISDEAKGDGVILKCRLLTNIRPDNRVITIIEGTVVYVPEYSLRQIEGKTMACSLKSIIAYEK